MEFVKSWVSSKTIWGGGAAVVAGLAGLIGLQVTPADQAEAVGHVTSLAAAIGGLVAIYGRIVASKRIG